ncbi:MAG: hypothetical protein A3I07_01420 [Candidatus Doudnabacteria bacterium RIFCSPLOWO2_02_FULL_42_9]|uniref:Uncharacterized protein n=1 Tax=Candidatus Doudnabacteria bacterium RIFCSPHIGHO2_01_FULL_41_86 TaxID=1817821 RepID=A0A1F5N919_9BACT|nr:MAG: hypothetical protein A2717_01420 [Candidatus Doudnabacteria bacterium RIFCSPHIGHO2_01_FULL_41_86]OGE74884.1 MAG: hypothetical protein A3K07_02990 [Candidatus Doudnabacteria bacterium RIFCSPHIGHO2_01_43_10]OGE85230.1 MAG: hypothetical protein A3E28_00990 [Candidatus Doudnabacteria bacterium RIFCSPHIGHO2_12_FULL_42_22]OGE86768.1 MAG: hypothetical protein A3C49_01825 [Candidatus Doudnabacteria bacterium RIFCSPHIGHO2_02_FULL_42_25]OGE92366.1 MAG: hypothetical protein A2895_01980 [Candidatus
MFRKLVYGPPNSAKDTVAITMKAIKSAFDLFRNIDFRSEINFDSLSQTEQDRIFNELVVTALCLVYFQTETLINFHEDFFREYLKEVKNGILTAYKEILKSFGIEEKFLIDWDKLLQLRLDEYRRDFNEHRHELPDVEEHNPWILVTAVGGFDHITRGRGQSDDPAYRRIVRGLIIVSDDTNKMFIEAVKRI